MHDSVSLRTLRPNIAYIAFVFVSPLTSHPHTSYLYRPRSTTHVEIGCKTPKLAIH
jgi:hypothetical protein